MRLDQTWIAPLILLLAALLLGGCVEDDGDGDDPGGSSSGGSSGSSNGGESIEHLDLGAQRSDEEGYASFSIDVPEGARAFTLSMNASDSDAFILITRLTAPDGQVLLEEDSAGQISGLIPEVVGRDGELVLLYPASPQWPWAAGTYEVEAIALDADEDLLDGVSYDTDVLIDTSGPDGDGQLDLIFWFTDGDYLSASAAREDADFQAAVDRFKAIFNAAGLTVADIEYRSVAGAQAQSMAVITSGGQKRALFALADGSRNALNVFFIDAIQDGGGGGFVTLGEASGIPSAPAHPSVRTGGVIISGTQLLDSPQRLAETIAHEAGHALGLFHTSEQDGRTFDPLGDTPQCTLNNDSDGDGQLFAEECGGAGADNLMFWTAPDSPDDVQERLSGDQVFVLERTTTIQ